MPQPLYHEDSYMKEFQATLTEVVDPGVVLDRSAFYPGGGGQPYDTGVLRAGGGSLDWEEPLASQSLTTIHTGSRPTDIDLMAKLVPEGERIIDSEEIAVAFPNRDDAPPSAPGPRGVRGRGMILGQPNWRAHPYYTGVGGYIIV